MGIMLKVQNLSVSYGSIEALKKVSMEVPKGSIVAILGANGGGKTTLLKKISGLIPALEGEVFFNGDAITRMAPERITQKGIMQSPEGRQIFGDLTVYENLMVGAFTVKDPVLKRKNLSRVYKYFPVLKERSEQVAVSLSGGEQQMLAIGRALMGAPKLLILDEPSLGLAPLIVRSIFEIIRELNKEGTTVLIVEQNALQTLKIADYAYVLQVGKIVKEGKAETLANDPELIEAYLGKDH